MKVWPTSLTSHTRKKEAAIRSVIEDLRDKAQMSIANKMKEQFRILV